MLRSVTAKLVVLVSLCGSIWAAELPGVWLDVPFVAQAKEGCGSASIAMLMQYWAEQRGVTLGPDADAGRIQQRLYSQPGHGIYASDLEGYLTQHGFRTFPFRGGWDDLEEHLAKGRPLIVALKPSGNGGALHYVVVAGVNAEPHFVLVNDPAERKLLKRDWSTFEREWSSAGNWTLLAVPQPDPH